MNESELPIEAKLNLPIVELNITNTINTPATDMYEANVMNSDTNVGRVVFQVNKKRKEISIQNIQLTKKRQRDWNRSIFKNSS